MMSQEELQQFYVQALPGFLEYLRTHQSRIEDVELATVMTGIKSMPATQTLGGVEKTVRVPLALLVVGINDAEALARQMAEYAREKGDYAKTQGDRVDESLEDLSELKQSSIQAAAAALEAADDAIDAALEADESRLRVEGTNRTVTASEADRSARWSEMMSHPMVEGENHNWWAWDLDTHSYYDTGVIAGGSILYPIFEQDLDDGGLYMTFASELEAARFYQDESDGGLYFYPAGDAPSVQQSGNQ